MDILTPHVVRKKSVDTLLPLDPHFYIIMYIYVISYISYYSFHQTFTLTPIHPMDRTVIFFFSLLLTFTNFGDSEQEETLKCYECNNSVKCISYSNRCDMKKDCPDGDDEVNCIPSELCPYSTSHRCSDSGECIDLSKMCNHDVDCPNGEDEMDDYCYHPGIVEGNVFQESLSRNFQRN